MLADAGLNRKVMNGRILTVYQNIQVFEFLKLFDTRQFYIQVQVEGKVTMNVLF